MTAATGLIGLFVAALLGSSSPAPRDPLPARDDARATIPLVLDDVLASAMSSHPELEAVATELDAARAFERGARGAWDPTVQIGSQWMPFGYYPSGQFDAQVKQQTPLWGIDAFAGYRLGWGEFPTYKAGAETLSGGELRAGVNVPLWKDGPIDADRAKIQRTRLRTQAVSCRVQSERLALTRSASEAYWRWVAAGQEVRVQRSLLAVARVRDDGLRAQAELGAVAEIVAVDNRRLVLEREAKLIAAEQAFERARLALSLFLRDQERQPVAATIDRVPVDAPPLHVDLPPIDLDVEQALRQRPELCELAQTRRQAAVEVRYFKNQVAPAIDAQAFVAQDFGAGPRELAPTELGVGLSVEVPVALRRARGDHQAAQAAIAKIDAQLRAKRDEIGVEVRQARARLVAAQQTVVVAVQQFDVARRLAEAERERFRQGASDLVVVNLRELAAAEAARLEIEARADHHTAWAAYRVALGAVG